MVKQGDLIFHFEKPKEPQIEISIAWSDDEEFQHEGYYDNVDEAIEALLKYKTVH